MSNTLQVEPEVLKQKIEKGENIFIIDVRTPEEYNSWKISYDKCQELALIPIDKLISSPDSLKEIPKEKEILTVCSHGIRSMMGAKFLRDLGYNAKSVNGGMAGWNRVYDFAIVPLATSSHAHAKVWQIRRISKGCMAYFIVSAISKNTIVIDPHCETMEAFLNFAKQSDLHITKVIDTHIHADHVSGAFSLGQNAGANVYISAYEPYDVPDLADKSEKNPFRIIQIKEGDKIELENNIQLKALHTPGHSVGSMSFVLQSSNGENDNNDTSVLFSGDTLFVNGIGRPDLHDKSEEYTNSLYLTYQEQILKFPEKMIILPAHYSGSFKHGEAICDTLGSVRKQVKALSMRKEEFVRFISESIPPQPINYRKIMQINRKLIPCSKIYLHDLEAGPNSCGIGA